MATELFPRTRALIAHSDNTLELADFSAWLCAEQYTPDVIHKPVFVIPPRHRDRNPRFLALWAGSLLGGSMS
jgi:hypothetical protein